MKDVYVAEEKKVDELVKPEKAKPRKPEEYSEVIRNEPVNESPLAAFMVTPERVRFETQDAEEKVLLLLRKHVVTNVGWVVASAFFLTIPLFLGFLDGFGVLPANYQVMVVVLWYMVVLGYVFEKFLSWYFNVYIITDERIIDYDFYSLLYKRVSEAKIDKVEDVTYQMGGTLMNLFNFGNVFIQTAGEQRELDFEAVPRPELVVKLLNELTLEEEREKIEGRVR